MVLKCLQYDMKMKYIFRCNTLPGTAASLLSYSVITVIISCYHSMFITGIIVTTKRTTIMDDDKKAYNPYPVS